MTNRTDPAAVARPGTAQGFAAKPGNLILAIETGSRACSVAISEGMRTMVHETEQTDHGHATMLMPMIERVRAKAGCDYQELGRIAVAVGPGSFTGIRVGLAAALGLSLASGVPAVGISSFHVVAWSFEEQRRNSEIRLLALLDSRRDEPFLAEFDRNYAYARPPAVVTAQQLDAILEPVGPMILVGDAPMLELYRPRLEQGIRVVQISPNASHVALLAADPEHRYDLPPKPVYVRAPDVTLPKSP
jgi:tRNA threonylcarbamoyladenosine biosynthesis protein TsaB